MKTQTPNQAKKGKMKKREWEDIALSLRSGLVKRLLAEGVPVTSSIAKELDEFIDIDVHKTIAQEREQVLGKVEKYFRENYIAGHIEDDEELIILKGWSDKWFKFLNSLRTQEKGEK